MKIEAIVVGMGICPPVCEGCREYLRVEFSADILVLMQHYVMISV